MDSKKIVDFGAVTGICLGHAVIGQPLMTVFCYHVDGVLIDTSAANNRRALTDVLRDRTVERIALTHYHEDHAGNAAYLKKIKSVPVLGHPLTAQVLAQRVPLRPYEHFMWGGLQKLEVLPLPEVLDTGRYQFQVIHTPGHSVDHVVFFEAQQGWLFSGDMFLGPRIKYFRRDECLYTTISSLSRLAELPFETLFCGHNPQTKSAPAMIRKKRNNLLDLYERVADARQKGYAKEEILKHLCQGREQMWVKLITLGDVSFKNMVRSALHSLERGHVLSR
jgi:glyoxylase-like metal-dependent hydrolase (beta-lactamase superfamily II)